MDSRVQAYAMSGLWTWDIWAGCYGGSENIKEVGTVIRIAISILSLRGSILPS
jgi:hypothetical protein